MCSGFFTRLARLACHKTQQFVRVEASNSSIMTQYNIDDREGAWMAQWYLTLQNCGANPQKKNKKNVTFTIFISIKSI